MRPCAVGPTAVGKKLAKTIIPASGMPLLTAGTTLTPASIDALRRRGYSTVVVENELIPGVEIPDILCEETRAQALRVLSDTAARAYFGGEVNARMVKKAVEAILAELAGDLDLAFSLTTIKSVDEYTFQHSLDVCVYAVILGRHKGYSQGDLLRLGVGALLHDIGKVRMGDLVAKRGPLTGSEWERIKEHPRIGYDLLRSNFEISLLSAHVAFQHHERWDGTGYPRGRKGTEIHEFGLVAAVANVWSALTTDRPYRAAMDPAEAAKTVIDMAGKALEPSLARALLSRVARYPTGSIVLLEDLRVGAVTAQEAGRPERPVITLAAACAPSESLSGSYRILPPPVSLVARDEHSPPGFCPYGVRAASENIRRLGYAYRFCAGGGSGQDTHHRGSGAGGGRMNLPHPRHLAGEVATRPLIASKVFES